MRVLVCGGRKWGYTEKSGYKVKDHTKFVEASGYILSFKPTLLISGGAKGADEIPKFVFHVPWDFCPADWKTYGKAAGPIRNQQMLDEGKPDLVIAFPGGSGTADMVRRAKKAGVKVVEID